MIKALLTNEKGFDSFLRLFSSGSGAGDPAKTRGNYMPILPLGTCSASARWRKDLYVRNLPIRPFKSSAILDKTPEAADTSSMDEDCCSAAAATC